MFGRQKSKRKRSLLVFHSMKADTLRHVKPNTLKTCRFHRKNRPKSASDLKDFDVVLTTYSTLYAESKSGGVLHQVDWYRIVLDEGKPEFHIRDRNEASAI